MCGKITVSAIIKNNTLAETTIRALTLVCSEHNSMGETGKDKDVINQFGEQALKADLSAEQTLIEFFRQHSEEIGITIEIRGEETATSILGNRGEKYFAVLDGLDGSENYLNPNSWPYGTMFAIAKGENPTYEDFEVAAIGLPQENWIVIAVKNSGVFVYDITNQSYTRLKPFDSEE